MKKKAKIGGKGKEENGVDVSDMERSFSHQEWTKLSQETRSKIQSKRQAKKDKRSINKVTSSKDNEESQDESVQKPSGNGGQFGSGLYNKDKKRKGGGSE